MKYCVIFFILLTSLSFASDKFTVELKNGKTVESPSLRVENGTCVLLINNLELKMPVASIVSIRQTSVPDPELGKLRSEVEELNKQLVASKNLTSSQYQTLQKQEANVQGATSTLDELKAENTRLQAELTRWQNICNRQIEKAKAAVSEKEAVQSDMDKLKAENKEREAAISYQEEVIKNKGKGSKIQILDASFRQQEILGNITQPVMDITLVNRTNKPISKASFHVKVIRTGRHIPEKEDNFSFAFEGGIEPGEQKTVSPAPNMFSDWGKIDVHPDTTLEVTCKAVFDQNGDSF